MKLSLVGRFALAAFASLTLGLGMTACGGGTVAYMWVLGQQYNQIAGFKIDDYTGNLTAIQHQPFSTAGQAPVSIVVKPGYRYVYVLNQGTGAVAPTGAIDANGNPTTGTHANGGNIAVFSVGGDGTLTFQQSYSTQGFNSKYLAISADGATLYALDQYAPDYAETTGTVKNVNGSITAFSIDGASGRLSLIQDTQALANSKTAPTYFEVGSQGQANQQFANPFMLHTAGNCLFVATPTAVVPFAFGSGGQLVTTTNGGISVAAGGNISSIGGNGTFLTVTDDQLNTLSLYQIGSGCTLNITAGGPRGLAQDGTAKPEYSFIDNSGNYVYVLNQLNLNPVLPASTMSGFKIVTQSGNQLQPLVGSPYGVGSGPVCMAEDPTSQYLYVSNHNDGTVSGFYFDNNHGFPSPLSRGSTFQATGQLECLAISGGVS